MLGSEQRHKFHAFGLVKNVNGRAQTGINAARIGHQTDTFSDQAGKATFLKHFNAGFHLMGFGK